MPRLEDIKAGNFTVTDRTSLSHNGQIYRGKKEINELIQRVLPDESEAANEPAAKASRKLSKSQQRRQAAIAADKPAGDSEQSDDATAPTQPADA